MDYDLSSEDKGDNFSDADDSFQDDSDYEDSIFNGDRDANNHDMDEVGNQDGADNNNNDMDQNSDANNYDMDEDDNQDGADDDDDFVDIDDMVNRNDMDREPKKDTTNTSLATLDLSHATLILRSSTSFRQGSVEKSRRSMRPGDGLARQLYCGSCQKTFPKKAFKTDKGFAVICNNCYVKSQAKSANQRAVRLAPMPLSQLTNFSTNEFYYQTTFNIDELRKIANAWGVQAFKGHILTKAELVQRLANRAAAIKSLPPFSRNEELLRDRPDVIIPIARFSGPPTKQSQRNARKMMDVKLEYLDKTFWLIQKYDTIDSATDPAATPFTLLETII